MVQDNPLPDGWTWTTLGKLGRYINGRAFKPSDWGPKGRPIIRIQNLTGSTNTLNRYSGNVEEKYIINDGDLLISWSATLGVYIYRGEEAVLNQHIFKVEPYVNKKFLFYLVMAYLDDLKRQVHGSGMQHITKGKFENSPVPLPPTLEQERIIAKIEELFTQLEAGTATLRRVQAGLKRYKASVLKAACEGRLVEQNPNEGNARELIQRIVSNRWTRNEVDLKTLGKGSMGVNLASFKPLLVDDRLPKIPECWTYARVDSIGTVQLGRQRSPKNHSGPYMYPYLRAANITWEGLNLFDVMRMNFPPSDFAIHNLIAGDVLLSEASGSPSEVGKPALWKGEIADCCIQNTIIRVRSLGPLPEYLYIHFLKDAITKRFASIAKGVGIHHLGAERISAMLIAIPPLAEQQRIVDEVERQLSVIAEVESVVEAGLKRAGRLRQAILKRAFEGRLVPQETDDEKESRVGARREESGWIAQGEATEL